METQEELRQRVQREQKLITRIRLATIRLAEAQRERIWAIASASEEGLQKTMTKMDSLGQNTPHFSEKNSILVPR